MPASELGKNIATSLRSGLGSQTSYSSTTPGIANSIIASEITKYLLKNTRLSVSYIGIIPGVPPVPEALLDPSVTILGSCNPPTGTTFQGWLNSLGSLISSGFFVGPGAVVPLVPTIPALCMPKPLSEFITQEDMKKIHTENMGNPQEAIWIKIAEGIFDFIGSQISTTLTYPASLVGTGTATITLTTII